MIQKLAGLILILSVGLWLAGCAGAGKGEEAAPAEPGEGQIRVATCQFPVSNDISRNAEWIRRQMRQAAEKKADVMHFSECALSGYAGKEWKTLEGFDYSLQRKELESILSLAKELRVWVVLGATHELSGGTKPHNSLYIIDSEGRIADRYDKRFCTGGDLKHYTPGGHPTTFAIRGVRCGALICYDARFPELYRDYAMEDVQVVFHSFHNAGMKKTAVHPIIMPATLQGHAGMNHMFISANNSTTPDAWPSLFIRPDGLIGERMAKHRAGVMVNLVDLHKKYYDASGKNRKRCILGKRNSGQTAVNDPRSEDRRRY